MNAISITALQKTYSNGTLALKSVDLMVPKGDFFALLGANGAGKTSLIGVLTSLVQKDSGEVKIFGHDIDHSPVQAKQKIGLVPQEFNFNIFEKVEDIIVTQGGYFGVPRALAKQRAEVLMKALGLWEKRKHTSRTLSGGMKRRLMIARALIHEPELLLLDEPTAGVDVELRKSMWEFLKNLNKKGVTILLTTHYLEEAEQLCKNLAIIKEGRIATQGAMKEILKSLGNSVYKVSVDRSVNIKKDSNFSIQAMEEEGLLEVTLGQGTSITELIEFLGKQGVLVLDIERKGNRLETLFLNILDS
jgi:ABC-2 type transport system ATP-binding protein